MHNFVLRRKVRGQGRPRFGNGRAYKAKADTDYEREIADKFVSSGGRHFGSQPLMVSIDVYRALPKSAPKSVKTEPDTLKPDCDNIAKAVLDALNGVAWDDDSQVVSLQVRKWPRRRREEEMVVTIREVAQ